MWKDPETELVQRLCGDSMAKISISYTQLKMFQNIERLNAVMMRIQVQKNDNPLAQKVNQDIQTLIKSKTVSVHYANGQLGDHNIVYVALMKSPANILYLRHIASRHGFVDNFEVLDKAWRNTQAVTAARLFEDSKAEVSISYASLPMFPDSKKYAYNAVIKRIQIPENDSQQVDKEIQIVMDTNEADSFDHEKTDKIAYIALNRDERNFFTSQRKGSQMIAEVLRNKALEEFKSEYPKL